MAQRINVMSEHKVCHKQLNVFSHTTKIFFLTQLKLFLTQLKIFYLKQPKNFSLTQLKSFLSHN